MLGRASLDPAYALLLVHFFSANRRGLTVSVAAGTIGAERGMVQYHMDELAARGLLVRSSSMIAGHESNWHITPAGRKYLVVNKFV